MKYPLAVVEGMPTGAVAPVYLKLNQLAFGDPSAKFPPIALQARSSGCLSLRGYFLTSRLDWIIVRDNEDELVLVPIKKGEKIG